MILVYLRRMETSVVRRPDGSRYEVKFLAVNESRNEANLVPLTLYGSREGGGMKLLTIVNCHVVLAVDKQGRMFDDVQELSIIASWH
jgi:hypothetical protein